MKRGACNTSNSLLEFRGLTGYAAVAFIAAPAEILSFNHFTPISFVAVVFRARVLSLIIVVADFGVLLIRPFGLGRGLVLVCIILLICL